uniref:Methyltransferase-like protein 23 n=1 Tax=Anthurium amnicola TaxID=1678845 RepID=A0A1D1YY46_9ARAE
MSEVEEDERGVPSPQRSSATIGANASSPSPKLTKISRHHFSDDDSNASAGAFSIDVIESMEEEYGMFIWPCSIVLAEYVWQQRKRFLNESVVELGAGTSLPGLVAAKVGADVTLTDISSNLEVLDNMKRSCGINKLNCKVFHHTNANRCRVFGFTFAHFMVYLADIRAHVGRMGRILI